MDTEYDYYGWEYTLNTRSLTGNRNVGSRYSLRTVAEIAVRMKSFGDLIMLDYDVSDEMMRYPKDYPPMGVCPVRNDAKDHPNSYFFVMLNDLKAIDSILGMNIGGAWVLKNRIAQARTMMIGTEQLAKVNDVLDRPIVPETKSMMKRIQRECMRGR